MRAAALLHFFLYGACLPGFINAISIKLYKRFCQAPLPLNDWLAPFYFPEKQQVLIFYVLSIAAVFVYYAAVYVLLKKNTSVFSIFFSRWILSSEKKALLYFSASAVFNLAVIAFSVAFPRIRICGLLALPWLAGLLSPFWLLLAKGEGEAERWFSSKASTSLQWGCLFFVFIQFTSLFVPFIKGPLKMINEFMDIPGHTLMGGAPVANKDYVEKHGIAGIIEYDPDRDRGASPGSPAALKVRFPMTGSLENFISARELNYHYDEKEGSLVLSGREMSPDEREELSNLAPTPIVKRSVNALFDLSARKGRALRGKKYSAEEFEFIDKNRLEFHWRILNRWVIHHHNFVLGPINEYALGRPLERINFQYGVLNALATEWLMKKIGGISYQNYFRVWYAYWPFYYAIFFLVAFFLLRDLPYLLLTAVLSAATINLIGHQFLFLGPGLNPVRHFFDMSALFMLVSFFKEKKKMYLVGAILMTWLSIVNNKEFGIFLCGAMIVTLLFWWVQERTASWGDLALVFAGGIGALPVLRLADIGNNTHGEYYLKGVLGFPIPGFYLGTILLLFSAGCLALVWFSQVRGELKYALAFLLIYSSEALFYYVWGGTPPHFLNVGSLAVLCAVTLVKFVAEASGRRKEVIRLTSFLSLAVFACVYLPSARSFYASKSEYEKVFETHKTYEWALDRAVFVSTMDPAYFEDSSGLLRKYARENGVYIISKYDNFVPFLAGKYSEMPFFETSNFLFTPKEFEMCVAALKSAAPEFLFVDTDILRSLNGEIIPEGEPFFSGSYAQESKMRVQRLKGLDRLFRAVKDDYRPLQKGRLITVYQRVTPAKAASAPR